MKKKYHTFGTILNSNIKIVEEKTIAATRKRKTSSQKP